VDNPPNYWDPGLKGLTLEERYSVLSS